MVYIDDMLIFGPYESEMESVIKALQSQHFQLKHEKNGDDNVYDILEIHIEESSGTITLTQHGLIKKFLNLVGMMNCNSCPTPCNVEPLASDPDGPWHSESWNYASAVGMLMYLTSNAHPEIQFAVHQCAMFTHCPCKCHTTAIKHIGHYLKGILTEKHGLILKPEGTL